MKVKTISILKYIPIFIIGFILEVSGLGYKTWQFYALIFLITIFGILYKSSSYNAPKEKQDEN